jgi:hypothetical protein
MSSGKAQIVTKRKARKHRDRSGLKSHKLQRIILLPSNTDPSKNITTPDFIKSMSRIHHAALESILPSTELDRMFLNA